MALAFSSIAEVEQRTDDAHGDISDEQLLDRQIVAVRNRHRSSDDTDCRDCCNGSSERAQCECHRVTTESPQHCKRCERSQYSVRCHQEDGEDWTRAFFQAESFLPSHKAEEFDHGKADRGNQKPFPLHHTTPKETKIS